MRYEDTIASKCRYGEIAAHLFAGLDIVWEESECGYSGNANVVGVGGGRMIHYAWDYGSCSGCDDWERRSISEHEILEEMKMTSAVLEDAEQIKKYCLRKPFESAVLAAIGAEP